MNQNKNKPDVKPLIEESLLAMVNNSVGSKAYQTFWATVDNKKKDIVDRGQLSCAFFVATLLHRFLLIEEPHLTVEGTIKDMRASGWLERSVKSVKPGNVLVWEEQDKHKHIGFYIGNKQAVSTSSITGEVAEHHYTFNNQRALIGVWVLTL